MTEAIGPLGPAGDAGEKEASDPETVRRRITEYLSLGGLFNPEMMEHDKVGRLIMDARDAIERLLSERKGLRAALSKYGAHTNGCRAFPATSEEQIQRDCNCGLIRALAATSAPQDKPKVTK